MYKKPNIVFILSDDQGFYSLGCLNNSELKTPNLDKLAKKGILFSNCYCVSPVCSPARASILTGCIPSRHGVHDWIRAGNINPNNHNLSQEEKAHYDYLIEHKAIKYLDGLPTYTKVLNDNGYECALSGKWHLGDSVNPQCGFTHWYTIGKGGCNNYKDPDMIENGKISFPKEYITDLITDKAVEYIDELANKNNPFYLSVHYIAPHTPWEPECHKKEHLDLYKDCDYDKYYPQLPDHKNANSGSKHYNSQENRNWAFQGYEASITAMDEGIGRIIDTLEKENVLDDTIIIFTSDNGFNLGHHGLFGKGNASTPLNMYDTSVKVPFIISCPNKIKSDITTKYTVSHYDFFPTILELAGIDYKLDKKQPGKSFVSVLKGDIVNKNNDIVTFDEYGATRMIRTNNYKYVHRFPAGPHEFYDLINDSGEFNNLYGKEEYKEIILNMRKRLYTWFEQYTEPSKDGTKENVTGSGQLCSVGSNAEIFDVFYND